MSGIGAQDGDCNSGRGHGKVNRHRFFPGIRMGGHGCRKRLHVAPPELVGLELVDDASKAEKSAANGFGNAFGWPGIFEAQF